jgi:hypothetical protein
MGMLRRLSVRTLLVIVRRERTACLLLAAAAAMAIVGYAWSRSEVDVVTAAELPVSAGADVQPERRDVVRVGLPEAAEEIFYAAPDSTVLAAFLTSSAAAGRGPAFVPAEIPVDSRLVPRPPLLGDESGAVQSQSRGPSVVLGTRGGYLAFYDALDGSFTNLPGAPCGTVAGRPAIARRVLGGDLVQWEVEGRLHAVFGWGLSRTVVVRVAAGMRPVSAVDQESQTPVGAGRRRAHGE